MAARHVRELQKHKGKFDSSQRLQYDILMVIATDVGRDNSPARTSHRGIAERAGCHYNTVKGKLADLVEWGWITIEKEGKFEYYHLTTDCGRPENHDAPLAPNDNCDNDCDNSEKLSQRLSQLERRLSQLEELLSQRLSQTGGAIVTNAGEDGVIEDSEDISEDSEEDIYIAHDLNADFQNALALVAKEKLAPGFNEKKFEDAAFALMGWDAELSDVAGFGDYWKTNGWHDGKPALTNIINHWQDYKDGNNLRKPKKHNPSANGSISENADGTRTIKARWKPS